MLESYLSAYCKKTVIRYGDVYFAEGVTYEINKVYDLILFVGEKNNMIQIENYAENDWFLEHFNLVVEFKNSKSEKTYSEVLTATSKEETHSTYKIKKAL